MINGTPDTSVAVRLAEMHVDLSVLMAAHRFVGELEHAQQVAKAVEAVGELLFNEAKYSQIASPIGFTFGESKPSLVSVADRRAEGV